MFCALKQMRDSSIVAAYAIGGATTVLFYAEPARTYDVDVFVTLHARTTTGLVSLASVYDWAKSRGIAVEGEHLMIEGVPVQVVGPEHLVALALQAGGARRRERAWQPLLFGGVDRQRLRAILDRHAIPAEIPEDV